MATYIHAHVLLVPSTMVLPEQSRSGKQKRAGNACALKARLRTVRLFCESEYLHSLDIVYHIGRDNLTIFQAILQYLVESIGRRTVAASAYRFYV
jgi:hypothetical protein